MNHIENETDHLDSGEVELTIRSPVGIASMRTVSGSPQECIEVMSPNGSNVIQQFYKKCLLDLANAHKEVRVILDGLTIPTGPAGIPPLPSVVTSSSFGTHTFAAEIEGGPADTVEEGTEADGKPKRRRRTKEEMAAARAADAVHNGATLAAAKANVSSSPVPVVAVAPAPIPIPGVPAAPPLAIGAPGLQPPAFVTAPDAADNGIPTILQRTAPPPPLKTLPTPPFSTLGPKVIEAMKVRVSLIGDDGNSLIRRIAGEHTQTFKAQAKLDEAFTVLEFIGDDKLRPLLADLSGTIGPRLITKLRENYGEGTPDVVNWLKGTANIAGDTFVDQLAAIAITKDDSIRPIAALMGVV